jgi:transposase-like protein
MKRTSGVAGSWAYLYRAVDSAGETIEFMLSPKRDLIAAKLFLRLALSGGGPTPRAINVDGHPAYPSAVVELQESGELGRRCRNDIDVAAHPVRVLLNVRDARAHELRLAGQYPRAAERA